jgi:hypothetical protein
MGCGQVIVRGGGGKKGSYLALACQSYVARWEIKREVLVNTSHRIACNEGFVRALPIFVVFWRCVPSVSYGDDDDDVCP